MYIFNLSFVIPSARKQSFVRWANSEGRNAASCDDMSDFRILEVAAIPGDPEFQKQSERNLSLQIAFRSLSGCRNWNEHNFPTLMRSYAAWYGHEPVFFATILKEL